MSNPVISIENVSKQYSLGVIGTGTFRDDLKLWWAKARNKPNPLALVNEVDFGNREKDVIWALRDVTFKVDQGEALGVIGRNGAGKSTLLKILSRVTTPTSGEVKVKGRIASLLEVGTGFHPELTGRENVFLNGAIMGMSRDEVIHKFDEIVDFSGVEKFIDTPVKRYSSGMYVRLAFAVAAHLEPDILIVDEVLAVGDAEFQKKCLGKMGEVAHEGRTVLFVSHNLGAIKNLCHNAVLLNNGMLAKMGKVDEVIDNYFHLKKKSKKITSTDFIGSLTKDIDFQRISINDIDISESISISPTKPIEIKVEGEAFKAISNFRLTFSIFSNGIRLFSLHDVENPQQLKGKFESKAIIPKHILRPGDFSLAIGGYCDGGYDWIWGTDLAFITIKEEWDKINDPNNIGVINLLNPITKRTN